MASLSPAVTEILYFFELEDQIVCTDHYSDYPEEVKDKPHLASHTNIHPLDLAEYEPDLIFTQTVIQEKLAEELKQRDLSVVHLDPRTIFDIYESIRSLGTILSCEDKAEELVLSMQQGFKGVKSKGGLLPAKPKVYIEEWHHPPMVSGNWVPDVIHTAGGQSFSINAGELSREVSLQEVEEFDPDMIVLSICGAGNHAEASLLTDREGWSTLRAVREGNVRVIDDALLNRPGPRLVDGAQRLYGWCFEMLH